MANKSRTNLDKAGKIMNLRPDRELLNPNFDGYKLALDALPVYESNLDSGISNVLLTGDLHSLQHVKIFSLHNHLHQDPWNLTHSYIVTDQLCILRIRFDTVRKKFEEPILVWEIPEYQGEIAEYFNISVSFVSPQLVFISDGHGTLYFLNTGPRIIYQKWEILYSGLPCAGDHPFVITHSSYYPPSTKHSSEKASLEGASAILVYVDDKANIENCHWRSKSPFITVIEWVNLEIEFADGSKRSKWKHTRTRRLAGSGSLEYVSLDRTASGEEGINVASDNSIYFIYDSVDPVAEPEAPKEVQDVNAKDVSADGDGTLKTDKLNQSQFSLYAWSQTLNEIKVFFSLSEETKSEDMLIKLTPVHFYLKLQKDNATLQGPLFSKINTEKSSWIIEDGKKLEVTLVKADSGLIWQELMIGDDLGEEIVDDKLIDEIHTRLNHLTADQLNADESGSAGVFNDQQLEDCDTCTSDEFKIFRFDGTTHEATHQVSLIGNQWLFNVTVAPGAAPLFCLRHDVDGVVWRIVTDKADGTLENNAVVPKTADSWGCEHVSTFHAFGYVQASKQDRKYLSCPKGFKYVALCDWKRHIYVYRQPEGIETELKNRKTGRLVGQVAKQQVVTLGENSLVLGFYATDNYLFALTEESLYAVAV